MNTRIQYILEEVFRRYCSFKPDWFKSEDNRWQYEVILRNANILATPSEVHSAINQGMLKSKIPIRERVNNWFYLTPNGAKVILAWHEMGYEVTDYNHIELPYYEDVLEKINS